MARTSDGLASIESSRLRLYSSSGAGIDVGLEGANTTAPGVGLEPVAGVSHYALDRDPALWIYNVPHFAAVDFRGVYPGVDLRYHLSGAHIEFDFDVANGKDLAQLRLRFDEDIHLSADGDLALRDGSIHKPRAWQVVAGERQDVEAAYRLIGSRRATFELGPHDSSLPVTIDPIVDFATYLGGSSSEIDTQTVVDSAGNIYVAGTTLSADFPASEPPGSPLNRPVYLRDPDIYVTRMKPDGSAIDWSFFIGGTAMQRCGALLQDSLGDIYVFGSTTSGNFPVTKGAWRTSINSMLADEFAVKLDAQTGTIKASTYLGFVMDTGSPDGLPTGGFSVDSAGGVYVSGQTEAGFQATPGAYLTVPTRINSAGTNFGIERLNSSLSSLVYATYIDIGVPRLLQADSGGNLIMTGLSGGSAQAFFAKLNPTASAFIYSSGFSGGESSITDLHVDGSGNAWIAGSIDGNGLTQVNPLVLDPVPATFPPISATVASPFFAEIPPQGGSFLQATLFYGPGYTTTSGHAPPTFVKLVFPAGRLCFVGIGVSAQTPGAVAADGALGQSSTLDCVDSTGTRLGIQTILPPPGVYTAVQPTPDGAVILAGSAAASGLATTPGVVQPGFAGAFGNYTNPLAGGDAFVLRVSLSNPAPQITSVYPASVFLPFSAIGTFNLTGTGFGYGTQITWNGQNIASTFNSPTQIAITGATAGAVLQPGPNQIGASLVAPGGGVSNPVTITGYNLPAGTLSVSPSSVTAGSAETTVSVTGFGLSPASLLMWNGSIRATTFLANFPPGEPGSLQFLLEPDEMAQPETVTATVTNSAPGGGVSPPAHFMVTSTLGASVPILSGPGAFFFSEATPAPATITLSGNGFTPATVAYWDGSRLPSAFISGVQLSITPPAGSLGAIGAHNIYVANGSLSSATLRFMVVRSLASLYEIFPAYDPVKQLIYVLGPPTELSQSYIPADLTIFNAQTGVQIGSVPGVMPSITTVAVSDDGSYLYIAGGETGLEVKGFNTASGAVDLDWQVALPPTILSGTISSLAIVPGSPQTLAIAAGGQIVIYDNDQERPLTVSLNYSCCGPTGLFATANRLFLTSTNYPCVQWWDFDVAGFEDSNCGLNPPELVTSNGFAWLTDGTRTATVNTPFGAGNSLQAPLTWAIDQVGRVAYAVSAGNNLQLISVNLDTLQQTTQSATAVFSNSGVMAMYLTNYGVRLITSGLLTAP